ncbi:hypothetical protein [Cystobacter fuscus]|uniref:hypothetical protein n=1 Tax=Cystobacter fuscus TaxID=43 RepID=UPI001E42AAA5|nr:hypothetical protein [Cystobacter fuscus]
MTNVQVSLLRREADVALRLDNNPAEGLVGRRVGRLQFEAYAARSLVERVGHSSGESEDAHVLFSLAHLDEGVVRRQVEEAVLDELVPSAEGAGLPRWRLAELEGRRINLEGPLAIDKEGGGVGAILEHLGLPMAGARLAPARGPPQAAWC